MMRNVVELWSRSFTWHKLNWQTSVHPNFISCSISTRHNHPKTASTLNPLPLISEAWTDQKHVPLRKQDDHSLPLRACFLWRWGRTEHSDMTKSSAGPLSRQTLHTHWKPSVVPFCHCLDKWTTSTHVKWKKHWRVKFTTGEALTLESGSQSFQPNRVLWSWLGINNGQNTCGLVVVGFFGLVPDSAPPLINLGAGVYSYNDFLSIHYMFEKEIWPFTFFTYIPQI